MPRKISRTHRSQQSAANPLDEQPHDSVEIEYEPAETTDLEMSTTFERGEGRHEAGKRDVELYIRTYNTLLRSSGEVSLKALIQAHLDIDSSLHPEAHSPYPD